MKLLWLALAFTSAALLGLYDTSKKAALKVNDVLPVLLLNTLFSTLIFSPLIVKGIIGGSLTAVQHALVVLKAFMVLSSWIFGYIGLKHLPITIVGPINATRPVLVLVGAMLIYNEHMNLWQWSGVILAAVSLFLLSISSKKEKIDFLHNHWIWCTAASAIIGASCGLYDKYIVTQIPAAHVQGWYNFYQLIMMSVICLILRYIPMWKARKATVAATDGDPTSEGQRFTPLQWRWSIPLISIFLSAADYCYLIALEQPGAMISVVSLVRRSSVVISFICGVIIFKERTNLKAKIFDLSLVLLGMVFIWLGTR